MIRKLVAGNFRSLGERVEVPLGQMTVLVGANAAGKSSIIDILRFLNETIVDGVGNALVRRSGLPSLKRRGCAEETPVTIGAEFAFPFGQARWEFDISKQGEADFRISRESVNWDPDEQKVLDDARAHIKNKLDETLLTGDHERWKQVEKALNSNDKENALHQLRMRRFRLDRDEEHVQTTDPTLALTWRAFPDLSAETGLALPKLGEPVFRLIVNELLRVGCYTVFPGDLRAPQKPDAVRRRMEERGGNWTSTLRRLKRETAGKELLAGLNRIVGDITDYRVSQVGGYLSAEFCHGGDTWLDTTQESDGTLRMAGLLTALLQEPPLALCCIEEPELTVHPGALPVLFDFLTEATKRTQIVLSTHSPELLDLVDVEQLLVVERRGMTTVAPVDKAQREVVRQHLLTTSDLLRSEGLRQAPP